MDGDGKSCIHESSGLCSRCSLNQTFAISKAEERKLQLNSSLSYSPPEKSMPLRELVTSNESIFSTISPQCDDDIDVPPPSEVMIKPCSGVKIQEVNNPDDEYFVSVAQPLVEPPSWLMRMVESPLFNSHMAMQYLFSSTDKPALFYLGRRLNDLPEKDVDFYIPQLINLYIHKMDAASVIHAYIEKRCKKSVHFSLLCVWLLERLANLPSTKNQGHSAMLRQMIIHEFRDKDASTPVKWCEENFETSISGRELQRSNSGEIKTAAESVVTLPRSESALEVLEIPQAQSLHGDATHGSAATSHGMSSASEMTVQSKFVSWLGYIGKKISEELTKEAKMIRLKHEVGILNFELPARCWVPFSDDHHVVRIPPDECSVLNSKDKTPYVIYVEVIRVPVSELGAEDIAHEVTVKSSQGDYLSIPSSKKPGSSYQQMRHDPADPSAALLSEPFAEKKERIRTNSPFGASDDWDLIPVIVKSGEDLAQELFAYQLLCTFKDIWDEEGVPVYIRPYKITLTSPRTGFIECITDSVSLHQIKRHQLSMSREERNPLLAYFKKAFGQGRDRFLNAQKKFIQSLAGYSLISYFLQLKDRHNGNILIDGEGHLIHIDFGFLLSSSPKNLGFETSPFKLTSELIEVMGGLDSDMFLYFKSLLLRGLIAARKHHQRIISLVEIMSVGSAMPCFRNTTDAVRPLLSRFHVSFTDEQLQQLVNTMVESSRDSLTTRLYDNFQYYTNGIL